MELFRKGKTGITAKFHTTDLVVCSHSRKGKILSYSQINTVDGKSVLQPSHHMEVGATGSPDLGQSLMRGRAHPSPFAGFIK